MYYIASNELYHHGVIGQKWGIRRYQPYPKGYTGSGKEIGQAAKVKQRVSSSGEKKPRYANNPKAAEILKKYKKKITDTKSEDDDDSKKEPGVTSYTKGMRWGTKKQKVEVSNQLKDLTKIKDKREIGSSFLQNRKEKKAAKEAAAKKKEFVDRMNKAKAEAKALKEQQAAEEEEKKRVLTEGTATELKKYANDLSNQELRNAIERIQLNNQLNAMSKKDVETAFNKIDKAMTKLDKINKWTNTSVTTYQNVNKVLNMIEDELKKQKSKQGGKK